MGSRNVPLERIAGLTNPEQGLTASEVEERRRRYGVNDVVDSPQHPWRTLLLETAKDPMLWFFIATGALYAVVGQWTESLTLLVAILPLLGMDVYLHRRTQASTEGLQSQLATRATVIRDGRLTEIPVLELVPGDLIQASAGEPFAADGIVVAAQSAQVDESALTGEAYPVLKQPLVEMPGDGAMPAVAEAHWAFAGTRLLTGEARVRVVFTGQETVYGEIVRSAIHGVHDSTPLQRSIAHLVRVLLFVAVGLCAVLAAVRLYQGHGWLDALISAVTLATAAIPEEFPVVFTVFLGLGVYRLALRKALVRRAVTVENIGRVSFIGSDKTGTITEGRLQLTHLLPEQNLSEERLASLACVASRTDSGDPMDEAICRSRDPATTTERVATFPFTEDRKRETGVVRQNDGSFLVAMKGAIEIILEHCGMADSDSVEWLDRIREFAAGAHKVIGVAYLITQDSAVCTSEVARGLQFAGLLAFEDPIRDGVQDAVQACRSADIHPIMVTGDHPLTAAAVAREVGLGGGSPRVVLGDDLEQLVADADAASLRNIDVIARAKPAQKLMLVRALQQIGEIVAVTGDGVNDVPALQAADIGVAMGGRGTRSAREVAAIVLLDDNFRTIVRAIGEGRQLFENLRASFQYLLIVHIPLVLTATLIPLAGYPLLYLPVHVVWMEMIIHPTAILVFQEQATRELVPRMRVAGPLRFFSSGEWVVIVATGVVIAAAIAFGYLRSLDGVNNVEHARAMALASFSAASAFVTAGLSQLRTRTAWITCIATLLLAVVLIQTPKIDSALHLKALHWDDWLLALAAGAFAAAIPMGYANCTCDAPIGSQRPTYAPSATKFNRGDNYPARRRADVPSTSGENVQQSGDGHSV